MTLKSLVAAVGVAAAVFASSTFVASNAWSRDAVTVMADIDGNWPTPTATVVNNGTLESSGTYAIGTIQVFQTVIGNQFPSSLETYRFCFEIQENSKGRPTDYSSPIDVRLVQAGSANVELNVLTNQEYAVTDAKNGWCSTIGIGIPDSVIQDPNFQVEGAELIGNLKITTPPKSNLNTTTNIQFHLRLAHPSSNPSECLSLLNFFVDNPSNPNVDTTDITSAGIEVDKGNSGNITSPDTPLRNAVAVVNTCLVNSQRIDLDVVKDGSFDFQNSGNAVQTGSFGQVVVGPAEFVDYYNTNDPSTTSQGTSLCLADQTLAPQSTLFMLTLLEIKSGAVFPSSLPFSYSGFSATVKAYQPACGTGTALSDPSEAHPNPANAALSVNKFCTTTGPTTTCVP